MSRFLRVAVVATVALGLASLPACNRGQSKTKIAVVTNCVDPFWDLCYAGAKQAEKDFDVEVLFRQPSRGSEEQERVIQDWVNQGVAGIGVSVIDPKGQTESLKLVAQKMPLITMDNDAPDTGRKCYVGVDNREAGKAVGRMVKKALPNGGTIAMFIGSTSSANGIARPAGVLEELATPDRNGVPGNEGGLDGKWYGNYFLVDGKPITDEFDKQKAVTNARDVLNRLALANKKDVCLIGLYAYNPPAILEAVPNAKLASPPKIVGFDEDLGTLQAIADGKIEGTVAQDPYSYGYRTVEALAALARGDSSKADAINAAKSQPYRVITRDGTEDRSLAPAPNTFHKASEYATKVREQFKSVGK